jgi:hypothetical protein
MPIRNTGAAAQPRLPLMPCTEKSVPQPRLRAHALVQDGEVHRVEGRIAQPGQRRRQHQAV